MSLGLAVLLLVTSTDCSKYALTPRTLCVSVSHGVVLVSSLDSAWDPELVDE